jgi:signal transduction histidine kinase
MFPGVPLNKSRDAISGAFSAFRVSAWSVRRKVVAVLALPVILAVVFGGLRVSSELTSASDYSTNKQRAGVLGPAVTYLAATERLALPSSLADRMGGDDKVDAEQAYAASLAGLKQAAASANLNEAQKGFVSKIIQNGDTLRNGSGTGITATAPVQLGEMTRQTNDLIESTLNTNGTPDPRVQGLVQALNARLSLVKQQLLIQSSNQQSSLLDSVWLAAEIGVEGSALGNLSTLGAGTRASSALASDNGTRLGEATTAKVTDLAATPAMFGRYDRVTDSLLIKINNKLAASAAASKSRALTDTAIILLALLASVLLALVVARALINPLRRVRAGALDVARVKLPETVDRIRKGEEPLEIVPIDVHTEEELGQLARAVDDMHRQAVSLATGEAQLRSQVGAMFVTLSRRNTTLVNQQLALIESLEQDEEDPQRLEQLFSLDHLATRMRRTAESLVILGGTTGRTASFEELSVSDVVHAAVSEVQDYQRVRIDATPDRMIVGRAASDVVHLMAELIDNALSYSPPGSPVTIQASEDNGRVEIEIIDSGLGMAGDALARANDSLKSGGEVTIDTARRMGLFVVSRLAEEHGLKVKLRRNANGGGIIASIILPTDVLVGDGPVEHVSIMDAPEPVEEPEVVVEEPEEEYDPYLERIEEAIAAVTGLPRRRPGAVPPTPEPVLEPAAPVSMWEDSPALGAAFEPMALPGQHDEPSVSIDEPAARYEEPETPSNVVSPVFGGVREAPVTDALDAGEVARTDEAVADVVDAVEPAADAWTVAVTDTTDPSDEVEPALAPADEPVVEQDAPVAGSHVEEPVDEPVQEPVAHDDTPQSDEQSHEQSDEQSEPAWPVTPVAEDEPVREPSVPVVDDGSQWGDNPLGTPAASVEEAPAPASAPEEPLAPVALAGAAAAANGVESRTEAPVRLTIRRPLSATPAAAALEGDHVPDGGQLNTPIFGQLRSNWLNDDAESAWSDSEVDRGWNAADRAESAETDTEGHTRTGLPVRRPGGRLVPGGVSNEPTVVARDPDAIRNRLAAHAAGVSRGRAAAAAQPVSNDYAHEETGPA